MNDEQIWLQRWLDSKLEKKLKGPKSDKNVTEIVYGLLRDLGQISSYANELSSLYERQNRRILASGNAYLKVGILVDEMLKHGCSQRQAFKFLQEFTGVGERQLANHYYKFRKRVISSIKEIKSEEEFEKRKNEFVKIPEPLFYYATVLPFFLSQVGKNSGDRWNPITLKKGFSGELPSNYPIAKRAYEKARDRCNDIGNN